jgi:cytochrome c oxidase cbb3-type subunit 3
MSRDRDELMDHEADGIREFDNDLPRWWLYGFYITIVFSVIYLVNYHVLTTPFFGAATVVAEYEADVKAAAALQAMNRAHASAGVGATGAAGAAAPLTVALLTDAPSLQKGRAIFESSTSLCSSCHRPDLGGLVGPNLTDAGWLHGCSVNEVMNSIRSGYPARGMLPFGGGTPLSDQELRQLASYVLSKRGSLPAAPKAADPEREKACTTTSATN